MTTQIARAPAQTIVRRIRVLAYTRLSDDPQGRRIDHTTQVNGINECIARFGLPPVAPEDWFSDTDTSASKSEVYRRGWQSLLDTIRNIDRRTVEVVLVCWEQARLMRELGDPAVVADLLENRRGRLYSAMAGYIEVRDGGRESLYFSGTVAALETGKIKRRGGDGIVTAAQAGRPHGPVGYGWDRVYPQDGPGKPKGYNVVNPTQATIVQELARRILAGDTLRGLSNEMNRLGIPAPGAGAVRRRDPVTKKPVAWASNEWQPSKIAQLLLRKSNVGIRTHRRNDTEPGDEIPEYEAEWPPLLDADTYLSIVAKLTDPARRVSTGNVAKHLQSLIATCGVCDEKLTSQNHRSGATAPYRVSYRCPQGHVSKSGPKMDALVTQAVLDFVSRKPVRDALLRDDSGAATRNALNQVSTLNARLETERRAHENGTGYDRDDYLRFKKRWTLDMEAAKAELARPRADNVYADLVLAEDKLAKWNSYTLDRRRAIVAATVKVVAYPRTTTGKRCWEPETVDITPLIEIAK